MATNQQVRGFEILESRGNPTVAAEVLLSDGARGFAASPSGVSTDSREALELRDGDPRRHLGKGVTKAVAHVNSELSAALVGRDAANEAAADRLMIDLDGPPTQGATGRDHPRRIAGARQGVCCVVAAASGGRGESVAESSPDRAPAATWDCRQLESLVVRAREGAHQFSSRIYLRDSKYQFRDLGCHMTKGCR